MALALVSVGQSSEYEDDAFSPFFECLACRSVLSVAASSRLFVYCFFLRLLAIVSLKVFCVSYLPSAVCFRDCLHSFSSITFHPFLSFHSLVYICCIAWRLTLFSPRVFSVTSSIVNLKLDRRHFVAGTRTSRLLSFISCSTLILCL
jgi:hypothetical protein